MPRETFTANFSPMLLITRKGRGLQSAKGVKGKLGGHHHQAPIGILINEFKCEKRRATVDRLKIKRKNSDASV
jgi:hypothetical protein